MEAKRTAVEAISQPVSVGSGAQNCGVNPSVETVWNWHTCGSMVFPSHSSSSLSGWHLATRRGITSPPRCGRSSEKCVRYPESPSALRNRRWGSKGVTETPTARNRWRHPRNRWPDTSSTKTFYTNVGFVHSPRLVGRLEMPSQSLLQLRTVILHPAPDRCVVDGETMLRQQFLNIA